MSFKSSAQRKAAFARMNKPIPFWLKNTTHKQFVHYDFDKDGTPNIDDKKPFNSKLKEPVDIDSSYSKEFRLIEKIRKEQEPVMQKTKTFLRKNIHGKGIVVQARLKTAPSILNKMRRITFPEGQKPKIEDIASARIVTKGYDKMRIADEKLRKLNWQNRVTDDFYEKPHPKSPHYKAVHHNVLVNGVPVEIQVKTKRQLKLHDSLHKGHKAGIETGNLTQKEAIQRAEKYHNYDLRPDLNK